MKNLFTLEDRGLLQVEKEGEVYRLSCFKEKTHTFIDCGGNVIDYSRPPLQDKVRPIEIDDPDFFSEIGEGFYVYTTHEVTYDVDGEYGKFGIKYINGKKLTDEIYYQVGRFCNGLCSVSEEEDHWGCINTKGELVIPYRFGEAMFFNEYGVAVGDFSLIDRQGNEIPDTAINNIDDCGEDSRYFVFSYLNEEQCALIGECGTAPDITVNIYDTKNRKYVIKDVPENRLDVDCFKGEPEVIITAAELLDKYD
ncbi:MAG: WG repeat-containing protein [Clostridia bacterium]|nr:WG repeat-containing protein [Clostridia bacterium]